MLIRFDPRNLVCGWSVPNVEAILRRRLEIRREAHALRSACSVVWVKDADDVQGGMQPLHDPARITKGQWRLLNETEKQHRSIAQDAGVGHVPLISRSVVQDQKLRHAVSSATQRATEELRAHAQ